MIVSIEQATGPIDFNGYYIYADGKKVFNETGRDIQRVFWEEDIFDLLTSSEYKSFENGKYEFTMTKKRFNTFNRLS